MDTSQAKELLQWIGQSNVLGISGGRVRLFDGALILPVSNGYKVRITLTSADDWTVERVFTRSGKETVRSVGGVYCDQVGEAAWYASCFRSHKKWGQPV